MSSNDRPCLSGELPAELVLPFIRGETHWSTFADALGLRISFPRGFIVLEKSVPDFRKFTAANRDLAIGILRKHREGPKALHEWASVIEAFNSIQRDVDSDVGERIDDALLAAMDNVPIPDDAIRFLESLAANEIPTSGLPGHT